MESAPSFHFRHRVGNLHWKLISSLDIDAIVEDHNITELQSVLDNITFCEFTSIDVRNNSIESVTKVVKVMQLIIEYLLHCQENQYKTIQSVHKRNSNLKNSVKSLTRDIAGLKEDCVIYQRQLAILRQSLSKAQDIIRDNKIHGPLNLAAANQVVDTSSRENMNMEMINALFDQHRATYMKDIEHMMTNSFHELIKVVQADQNKPPPSNEIAKVDPLQVFRENVECMLKESLEAMERKTIETIDRTRSSSQTIDLEAVLAAKLAEVQERELSLNQREQELIRRENTLRKQIEDMNIAKVSTAINTDPSVLFHVGSSTSDLDAPKAMISTATSMTKEMTDLFKQKYSLGFKLLIYFYRISETTEFA